MATENLLQRANTEHLELLLPMIAAFCQEDRHEYDPIRISAALRPLLRDDCYGVVWLIGAPVTGYAVITWGYSLESGGVDALLDELYVAEREQGLGSKVMQAILADLSGRGISTIFLETESHNQRVRAFYRRHGFVEEDSIWMARNINTLDLLTI